VLATMVTFVVIQAGKLLVANAALVCLLFTANVMCMPREPSIGRVKTLRTFVQFAGYTFFASAGSSDL